MTENRRPRNDFFDDEAEVDDDIENDENVPAPAKQGTIDLTKEPSASVEPVDDIECGIFFAFIKFVKIKIFIVRNYDIIPPTPSKQSTITLSNEASSQNTESQIPLANAVSFSGKFFEFI